MRTALITVGDKQQVVLQPENVREHRILQMLLSQGMDIQIDKSELEVTEHGSLRAASRSYGQTEPHPYHQPVMVQVQPGMPVPKPVRDPEVIVVRKSELLQMLQEMRVMTASVKGIDDPDQMGEFDTDWLCRRLERLRQQQAEPSVYRQVGDGNGH